jgi:hypothetical protein
MIPIVNQEGAMKMRSLMLGVLAVCVAGGATAARAGQIELAVSQTANAVAEIKVDGADNDGPYDEIRTDKLDYVIAVRGAWNYQGTGHPPFFMWVRSHVQGYVVSDDLVTSWKNYAVSRPYIDPMSQNVVNARVSPIEMCNERLQQTARQGREQFLKQGVVFTYSNAYEIGGNVYVLPANAFDTNSAHFTSLKVPVKITCMPLNRPRPRTDTSTTGAPPRPGKPMPPTIAKITLRVEPAKVVQDGKFLCPSQLKLFGYVEARRKFYGKALFVGPHYLTSITTLNFQAEGSRSVTATYTMDWHKVGGFTTAPNAEPKKQKLTFRFNVANKDGKLLDSAEETVEVSCKKIKVNAPTAGDGMTVNPAN